jgi:hypothetical protein
VSIGLTPNVVNICWLRLTLCCFSGCCARDRSWSFGAFHLSATNREHYQRMLWPRVLSCSEARSPFPGFQIDSWMSVSSLCYASSKRSTRTIATNKEAFDYQVLVLWGHPAGRQSTFIPPASWLSSPTNRWS